MSNIKVKRKGQVTIPVELRRKLKIEEGSQLEAREHEHGIFLKPVKPLEGGDVVGEEAYKQVLQELESLRKKWR